MGAQNQVREKVCAVRYRSLGLGQLGGMTQGGVLVSLQVPSTNMAIFLTLRPLDFSINNSRGLVPVPT